MPQIIIKGVPSETLKSISNELSQNLAQIMNCPEEYFLIECLECNYVGGSPYPLIEVKWFDRGHDIKKSSALYITQLIQNSGYDNVEVYFTSLQPSDYFENGVQLG